LVLLYKNITQILRGVTWASFCKFSFSQNPSKRKTAIKLFIKIYEASLAFIRKASYLFKDGLQKLLKKPLERQNA